LVVGAVVVANGSSLVSSHHATAREAPWLRQEQPRGGVEDAIKITTGCLSGIGKLVTGSPNLYAGIVGFLQTFCSFVRLFEQHGVSPARAALWVTRRSRTSPGSTVVSPSPQLHTSARTAAFEATCGLAPP
jgi:hypothetical protein